MVMVFQRLPIRNPSVTKGFRPCVSVLNVRYFTCIPSPQSNFFFAFFVFYFHCLSEQTTAPRDAVSLRRREERRTTTMEGNLDGSANLRTPMRSHGANWDFPMEGSLRA
jgi:hypothetical protein